MTDTLCIDGAGYAPKLLTIQEVADILRIHPRTAYRLVKQGSLNAIRVGTQWRVPESAMFLFLDRGWKNSLPERKSPRARQFPLPMDEPI